MGIVNFTLCRNSIFFSGAELKGIRQRFGSTWGLWLHLGRDLVYKQFCRLCGVLFSSKKYLSVVLYSFGNALQG